MKAPARILVACVALLLVGCASANDTDEDALSSVEQAATEGDNSSPTPCTTVVGPYPLNRNWDPSNTELGCPCIRTTGGSGTMMSYCATMPSTCGILYCTQN